MQEYTVKSGNGCIWGISTEIDQPGKTLTLMDGDVTLCHIQLDRAFPVKRIVLEDGTEDSEPGIVLNLAFVTGLWVKTDGHVEIHWF